MMALPSRGVAPKASRGAFRGASVAPVAARRVVVLRAQAEKTGLAKLSDSMGMPTDDGYFGFTPFAEQWAGRWAMLGFASSIVGEFATGKGALGQLGLEAPSTPLFAVLVLLFGGATVVATVATGKKALDNKMSRSEIMRYKSFLGLTNTGDAEEEAKRMKKTGDFTSPGVNTSAIEAARAAEVSAAEAASSASEPAPGTTMSKKQEAQAEMYPGEANDTAFARNVELTNGRWAMIGFLSSIVVEAATGSGILGQVVFYLKASGALGDKSGF